MTAAHAIQIDRVGLPDVMELRDVALGEPVTRRTDRKNSGTAPDEHEADPRPVRLPFFGANKPDRP